MKILVTGNQGYIGCVLTEILIKKKYEVVGYDTGFYPGITPIDNPKIFRQIDKDIRNVSPEDLSGIDAIIHLSALSNDPLGEFNPKLTEEINYKSTVKLAKLAKTAGVARFIYSSSQSMYGISNTEDELDEDNSTKNPLTAYAKTKWQAECDLKKLGSDNFIVVCFRPSTVFGASPNLRCDIVFNNLVGCAYTTGKIEVKSDGTPWRPVVHIKDVSSAFIAGVEAPRELVANQSFNVGVKNGNYTVRDLAEAAQRAVPGSSLVFTGEHGSDSRTYKVSFKKILNTLPEYFKPEWNLDRGGKELVNFFKKIYFTEEDFRGEKCNRLAQLKYLISEKRIDQKLYWIGKNKKPLVKKKPVKINCNGVNAIVFDAKQRFSLPPRLKSRGLRSRYAIKQAVIFAGGAGNRLRPFTLKNPKPMIPVNGKPFLEHLIILLRDNGIKEVVILTGYLGEKIKKYFKDGSKLGIKIKYSHTPFLDPDGNEIFNGVRLRNAKKLLDSHFLLMYCDNYWPLNLNNLTDFYKNSNTLGTIVVNTNKYGLAEYGTENNTRVNQNFIVTKYDKFRKSKGLNHLDMGMFAMDKRIFDLMPKGNFSFEIDILSKLVMQNELSAFPVDHRYFFCTSKETLKNVEKFLKPKKVVFLDRDGVINKNIDGDYVRNRKEFAFLPNSINAMKTLTQKGYQIYIVTNQRGIARGLMTKNDLQKIHKHMLSELLKNDIKIQGIYYCPHDIKDNCDCRKPKAGLFYQASNEHYLDLTKAVFIGNSPTDMEAGETAGCKTYLVNQKNTLFDIINQITNL